MSDPKETMDAIQERLSSTKKTSEATDISRDRLQEAESRKEKSFLDSITDPKSIINAGLALGALVSGQPGAAGLIAGIDLLGSPKEMAASKAEKKEDISLATEDLQDQLRKDTADQQKEIDQNITLFNRDPYGYITAMQLGGASNDDISQTLGVPADTTPNWFAMLEDSELKLKRQNMSAFLEKRIEEIGSNDPEATKALTKEWLKVNNGENLTDAQRDRIAEEVGKGLNDFDSVIGDTRGNWTPMSLHAAKEYFWKTKDGPGAWKLLSGVKVKQDLDDEAFAISAEMALISHDMTEFNDDGTIKSAPDTTLVISRIKDPLHRERARAEAREWGWAGTALQEEEEYNDLIKHLFSVQSNFNREAKAQNMPDRYMYKDTWYLESARQITLDKRSQINDTVEYGALADIDGLTNTIEIKTGFVKGSQEYNFVYELGLLRAREILGEAAPLAKVHRKATELISGNAEEYHDLAADVRDYIPETIGIAPVEINASQIVPSDQEPVQIK
ncbi:hypothetical protein GOV11_04525 [Candidatus Woesearchaeota archaeon]|nr:hypothetical protein [Candidatus Woesearchaeota archaeon]